MTFDDERRVTLLFGGGNRERDLNDLWAWDGRSWRVLEGARPSARNSAVFAYDSTRRKAVLYGGRTPAGMADDTSRRG